MRLPTMARPTASLTKLFVASALVLGACSNETTSPTAATPTQSASIERTSSFVPTSAAKSLFGVKDGTYVVTFDPRKDQSFALGPNHLDMPANSVCRLVGSGYGAAYWDKPCAPELLPVTLTVVIKNATSSKPSIQFFPAMRFNPANDVELFLYTPRAHRDDAMNLLMYYCPDSGKCVDESLTDRALQSYLDKHNDVVFRRIKHFSGYVVAERGDENSGEGSSIDN